MHFKNIKEDFTCENCGEKVKGEGYTDHCPKCLFGKHLDEKIPGDRLSMCMGLMKPTSADLKGGKYRIYYECKECKKKTVNRSSENDSFEKILYLTTKPRK